MNKKTEALVLEALELLLVFPENNCLEKEKSLLRFKLNQERQRIKIKEMKG